MQAATYATINQLSILNKECDMKQSNVCFLGLLITLAPHTSYVTAIGMGILLILAQIYFGIKGD